MTKEEIELAKSWMIETLRSSYQKDTKEEIRKHLQNVDSNVLRYFCNEIGVHAEHYEACQVAKEILNERGESL
ncbi:MAG: hypothetical protein ACTHOB_17410 [Ginsengibacter sp.]